MSVNGGCEVVVGLAGIRGLVPLVIIRGPLVSVS
jgi:hypothetical protein